VNLANDPHHLLEVAVNHIDSAQPSPCHFVDYLNISRRRSNDCFVVLSIKSIEKLLGFLYEGSGHVISPPTLKGFDGDWHLYAMEQHASTPQCQLI
jgi:hypothetical protein